MLLEPVRSPTPIARTINSHVLTVAIGCFCLSAVVFLLHFLLYRYSFPPNSLDEASFSSPAVDLATKGTFSTSVHAGLLPGADRYTYWMPPLYMVLLAGVFKIFGATVLTAKLFSFFLAVLAAYLITLLSDSLYVKIYLASLVLICPFIVISSAFIRMEALAIPLLTAAIVGVKFNIRTHWLAILAALMALTHPMLMPCSIALAFTIWRRGISEFIIFCLVALLTISPYLIYILRDIPDYKLQMGLQLERKINKRIPDIKFDYLLQFIPLTLLALFALSRLRKAKELRIFIGVGLTLSSLVILRSVEFNYQVYVMPLIIAVVGLVLDEMPVRPIYRYTIPLAVYSVFCALFAAKLIKYRFRSDKPYTQLFGYLGNHREWEGKRIFVEGDPDVAIFFLMNHQQVQRRNAVAGEIKVHGLDKYDYAVKVVDNLNNEMLPVEAVPWQQWPDKTTFMTTDGSFSLITYSKH